MLLRLRSLLIFQVFALASSSFISQHDVDTFDYRAAEAWLKEGSNDDAPSARTMGFGTKQTVGLGERCNDWRRECESGLFCSKGAALGFGRRCFPDATTCLEAVAKEVQESYGFLQWKGDVFDDAGVTDEDVAEAQKVAGNFDDFQRSGPIQALRESFLARPPADLLKDMQRASTDCMSAAPEGSSNSTGPISYLGFHFELGVVADFAYSLFYAQEDPDGPTTAFSRVAFGLEIGVGVEASGLVGIAFTNSTANFLGNSIICDSDIAVGPLVLGGIAGGGAVVCGFNGLVAIELTTGLGISFGPLGLSYAITSLCDETSVSPSGVPTNAPTGRPTSAPTGRPSAPSISSAPTIVLALDATVKTGATVENIYNTVTSMPGVTVVFNDDGQTCTDTGCTTQSTCSGTPSGTTSDPTTFPVTSSFSGSVASGSSGCCTCNSCVYNLLESEQFTGVAGEKLSIEYKAQGGGDWYEVLMVLYSGSPPTTTTSTVVDRALYRGDVIADFTTEVFTIPAAGQYFAAFFTASYDRTCGTALGASLTINGFVRS